MSAVGRELAQRRAAERACLRAELRLYLLAAWLGQGLSGIFAATGAAAVWVLPLCLLPGAAVWGLGAAVRRLWGAPTLAQGLQAGLGLPGLRLWRGYLLALLLWQGEMALTEVACLFSEGVVTHVAPYLTASVTLLAALGCCREAGLPRCVWLLRWPLRLLLALLLGEMLLRGRADHFLPLSGGGAGVNRLLCLRQASLGWPMLLLSELPPGERGTRRGLGPLPPALCAVGVMGAAAFALPTELALSAHTRAEAMLLPLVFLTPLSRALALTGWLLALVLALAISLRRGREQLCALGGGRPVPWGLGALGVLLWLPQLAGPQRLLAALQGAQPYLLAPGAALLLAGCLAGALQGRRGK